MNKHHPHHPIIYVRGFAASTSEIEEAVSDPYMGFNIGSTKSRRLWTGEVGRFFFESPLVRLMTDHDYDDVFVDGVDLISVDNSEDAVSYRSIVIFRYYDEASKTFGTGETPPIQHFAAELDKLILKLRDKICANPKNDVTLNDFRVHLVAHSMGGLICRAFLQNPAIGSITAKRCVDKFFTYATPHNGIDLRIINNVPAWATFGSVDNFNRKSMASYLGLPPGSDDVAEIRNFPLDRVFNLVGTNPRDYHVLGGMSAWAAGDSSDGLVRIENAVTYGMSGGVKEYSPGAFVHRSHSGHYGIVNSEEGYQNLSRFLFGKLRVSGVLEVKELLLPMEVNQHQERHPNQVLKASYQFQVVVSIRGCQWQMHRRTSHENSAIFRTFDQLFPKVGGVRTAKSQDSPTLFTVFLDPDQSVKQSKSVSFGIDLSVLVPDYTFDGLLFLKRHYEGGFIYRNFILLEAIPDSTAPGNWRVKYGFQSDNPGKPGRVANTTLAPSGDLEFDIPVTQETKPGIQATLRIRVSPWN